MPTWPTWCYIPTEFWFRVASLSGGAEVGMSHMANIARLAALGTWGATQGIYRFDSALLEQVITAPLNVDLSNAPLFTLPDWCIYIETADWGFENDQVHGFFAHLDVDLKTNATTLKLLIDTDKALVTAPIPLDKMPIGQSIACGRALSKSFTFASGFGAVPLHTGEAIQLLIEPMVALLLYVCTEREQVVMRYGHGVGIPVDALQDFQLPPSFPTYWEVGAKAGDLIRQAYHEGQVGCHMEMPRTKA